MKTIKMTFATTAMALVVANAIATTPLMAATPTATTQAAMQSACDAAKPDDQRRVFYTATPYVDSETSETIEVSRITITDIPGGVLLGQTPWTFTNGSEHRNGNSTNVHGRFTSVATYSGGKLVQEVTSQEVTTFTYGCNVKKTTNGVTDLAPPGQQVPAELTAVQSGDPVITTEEVSKPDTYVTLNDQRVICISPGSRRGTWTNQNGYTGTCNSALYLAVALGGPIPSNSVPGVERLLPNAPDQQTALPTGNSYYPKLPNMPEDFLEE